MDVLEGIKVELSREHMEAHKFVAAVDRLGVDADWIANEVAAGANMHKFIKGDEVVGLALSVEYDEETLEFYHFVQLTPKNYNITETALAQAPRVTKELGYKIARLTTGRPALMNECLKAGWKHDHVTLTKEAA